METQTLLRWTREPACESVSERMLSEPCAREVSCARGLGRRRVGGCRCRDEGLGGGPRQEACGRLTEGKSFVSKGAWGP